MRIVKDTCLIDIGSNPSFLMRAEGEHTEFTKPQRHKFTEKDYAFLMRKRAENSIKKLYCLSGKVLMSLLSPRLRPGLFSLRSVTSFRRIKKKLQIWRLHPAHITQIKNTKIFTWKFLISVIYSLFCNDIVIIVTTIF